MHGGKDKSNSLTFLVSSPLSFSYTAPPTPSLPPLPHLQEVRNSAVDQCYFDDGDSKGEGGGRFKLHNPPEPRPPACRSKGNVEIEWEQNHEAEYEPV